MPLLPIEKYIEKITFLESEVGIQARYRILEPFRVAAGDAVEIQKATRQIAEFVGLQNLTFVVGIATQEKGTGAHIELKHGEPGVFIEVSRDVTRFEGALLATLAHEISHKYMHIHQISGGPLMLEREREILTDITAMFLGLGKLMLNGSESKITRIERTKNRTTTTTESLECGYLDRDQLALAYLLVSTMRNVPPAEFEAGLIPEAKMALSEARRLYAPYFDGHLHETVAKEEWQQELNSAIADCQVVLAGIERDLLYLRARYGTVLDQFLKRAHKRLKGVQAESARMLDDTEIDPCLKFLSAVQQAQRVKGLLRELGECSRKGEAYNAVTTKLIVAALECDDANSSAAFDLLGTITCRIDGTKLRVPAGEGLVRVRCPRDKYEFQVNRSLPSSASPPPDHPKSLRQRLLGLWRMARRARTLTAKPLR